MKKDIIHDLTVLYDEKMSQIQEINEEIDLARESQEDSKVQTLLIERYPIDREVEIYQKVLEYLGVSHDVIYGKLHNRLERLVERIAVKGDTIEIVRVIDGDGAYNIGDRFTVIQNGGSSGTYVNAPDMRLGRSGIRLTWISKKEFMVVEHDT